MELDFRFKGLENKDDAEESELLNLLATWNFWMSKQPLNNSPPAHQAPGNIFLSIWKQPGDKHRNSQRPLNSLLSSVITRKGGASL
jgi:hypothetical protein